MICYVTVMIAFYISGLSCFKAEYDEKYTLLPRKTVKSTDLVIRTFIYQLKYCYNNYF